MHRSTTLAATRREALDALLIDSLQPVTMYLGGLYCAFALFDLLVWTGDDFRVQFLSMLLTGATLLGMSLLLKHWRPPAAWAHPLAMLLAAVVGVRLFGHMFSAPPSHSVASISLFVLTAGCFLLSNVWWGLLASLSLASWLWLAISRGFPERYGTNVYPLVGATFIAFLVLNVRIRSYSKLYELRVADDRLKTQLAEAVNSLKDRESWLREVADMSPVMIGTLDHRGKCTYVNQGWLMFIGRRSREQLGYGWRRALHRHDRRRCLETYTQASRTGQEFRLELRVRRPSGEYRWVLAQGRPWRLPDGTFDGFIVSAIDIHDSKQAEAAQRLSEARLQQILDNTSSVVFVKDLAGRYLLINRQYEECFHISRDEIRGMTDYELFAREVAEHVRANDRLVAETGELLEAEEVVPLDGEPHTYIAVKFPLRDASGATCAVCGIATDITNRKLAEEQIRQLNVELQHASRLSIMGEMVAGVAHEMHQPLGVISNYANGCILRMQRDAIARDEIHQRLEQISAEALRAGAILQGIRNFIRKREPQRRSADINTIIKEALQLAHLDSRRQKVEIRFEPREQPPVVADPIQITQVVLNLVLNAVDAMSTQPGRRQLHVDTITSELDQDTIEVAVADTGPGLSPEQRRRVFDQFYTTKDSGLGMGLSISKSIIEAHEGQLWVTPNAAGGCTFRFTLPTQIAAPDPLEPLASNGARPHRSSR